MEIVKQNVINYCFFILYFFFFLLSITFERHKAFRIGIPHLVGSIHPLSIHLLNPLNFPSGP